MAKATSFRTACPYCGSDNTQKVGSQTEGSQRWRCLNHPKPKHFTTYKTLGLAPSQDPRVLLLDIETLPMDVHVWDIKYRQRIPHYNIINDFCVLSWAAKWLCEAEIESDILTPEEAAKRDDRRILEGIWPLMDEANVVIGHNVDSFDRRRLNARFLFYDMAPPMPYQIIDTYKEAKRAFSLSSYKQDFITKHLGLTPKVSVNYDLWLECLEGNEEALEKMLTYNRNDVRGLEDVYMRLRPWIKSHPNMAIFVEADGNACPTCGHQDLTWGGQYYTTPVNRYRAFRCNGCRAIGRARTTDVSAERRRTLLSPVAR